MDPMSLRAAERILGVLIAGVLVYLGYRLFLSMPERTDSEGRFILPGNVSIYLSRVGPGVFFALFGAAVLVVSLYKGITYSETPAVSKGQEQTTAAVSQEVIYSGLGETETAGEEQALEASRALLSQDIFVLNNLSSALKENLPPERRVDIKLAIPRIKRVLMKTVWEQDWGDYAEFKEWVMRGAQDPTSEKLQKAAEYFWHGKEGEEK